MGRMRVIGLTGGIGTGKSTVALLLAEHGAALVDADLVARDVVRPGEPALVEIAARFGDAVLCPDGTLDRVVLGNIVFANVTARHDLESITHPRIHQRMAAQIAAALAGKPPLVVVDVPLLFENDRAADFDGVLLVYANAATQLQRIRVRDGLDDNAIRERLAAQLPLEEKRQRATWVIDNNGSPDQTRARVDTWWRDNVAPRSA